MRKDTLTRLRQLIQPGRRALLSTHLRPDGDGLGSEAALARLLAEQGVQAEIWNHDPLPPGYDFLFEGLSLRQVEDPPADDAYDIFFCLDVSAPRRLGRVAEYLQRQELTTIILDHHLESQIEGDLLFVDETAAATGEILYRLARELNWPVDQSTAAALWVALHTDTGGFRFSSTTARTLQVAAELMVTGIEPALLCERVYHNRRPEALKLLGSALNTVELLAAGRLAMMYIEEEMYHDSQSGPGDTERFVNLLQQISDVEAAILVYPLSATQTKVSLRGSLGKSIHALAKALGGGGHAQAAGAVLDAAVPQAVARVRQAAAELFPNA